MCRCRKRILIADMIFDSNVMVKFILLMVCNAYSFRRSKWFEFGILAEYGYEDDKTKVWINDKGDNNQGKKKYTMQCLMWVFLKPPPASIDTILLKNSLAIL